MILLLNLLNDGYNLVAVAVETVVVGTVAAAVVGMAVVLVEEVVVFVVRRD